MEFVGNIVDFGSAPEFHVTGISRVELISPNVMRVSYCVRRVDPAGRTENRVVCHLDWDREVWLQMAEVFLAAKDEIFGALHEEIFVKTTH